MAASGWIGVDLDGTLATYGGWKGVGHIGEPVPAMVARVKKWLAEGTEVRIFTARVCQQFAANATNAEKMDATMAGLAVEDWTEKHFGQRLAVTAVKDFAMIELWDDRAVSVEMNTGRALTEGR